MNSPYVGWQSRKNEPIIARFRDRKNSTRNSLGLRNRSADPLSKLVWDRYQRKKTSDKSTCPKFATPSGRQTSYELELKDRKLNTLGDRLLNRGDDTRARIQFLVSPSSSDLLGPEFSDDSSTELEEPTRKRREFVSLRGLSGIRSSKTISFKPKGDTLDADLTEDIQVALPSSLDRDFTSFFLTNESYTPEDKVEYLNSQIQNIKMPNDETGKPSSLSPWESKADDEVTFDKSTSPLENDEDEPAPMTSEIKVIRIGRDPDLPPKYPFETGQPRRRKPSRSAIHNGLLRSHRLQNFSHPSVISSTQQLLCLTPSRGVITLGSQEEVKYLMKSNTAPVRVKRFNEKEIAASSSRHLGTAVGIKPTGSGKATAYRLMQKDNSGPRSSSIQGHPLVLSNLHYKPTTQIRHPYRYTATSPASGKHSRLNATAIKTAIQRDSSAWSTSQTYSGTAYRIIENHMKHNRKPSAAARSDIMDDIAYSYPYQTSFNFANPVTHARKMAPVLRVIPALPRTTVPFTPKKPPESPIETEPTSQKRVRFSDQIGLPLVRHATPNYRRKHSYILRWLETAGRQAESMPSA